MGVFAFLRPTDRRMAGTNRAAKGVIVAATLIALLLIYAAHISTYFFLYDDFALVHESSTKSIFEIFGLPLFGFYRPLAFVLTKIQFAAFGWSVPGGYIAGSLLLHITNGIVVCVLFRMLIGSQAGLYAALLFLLSPWAAETYFWVSGRFDLLATFFVMSSVALGVAAVRSSSRVGAIAYGAAGCMLASAGLLTKEVAVVSPVLFFVAMTLTDGLSQKGRSRVLMYLASLGLIVALYLGVRELLLPGLNGAYGTLGSLLRNATLASNARAFAEAVLLIPFPPDTIWKGVSSGAVAKAVYACLFLALMVNAARSQGKIVALGLIGFAAAIAPVLWAAAPSNSSGAGRFLYLAGAWLCLPLGCGLSRLDSDATIRRSALSRSLFLVSFTLLAFCSLWSLRYQAEVWRAATTLARAGIAQLKPHSNENKRFFVTNLPSQFVQGPYVLKEYAFAFYFQNPGLQVRARPMGLEYTASGVRFAGWLGGSDPPSDQAETKVDLQLDVQYVEPMPHGGINAPRANSVVRQPFDLIGWAIDTSAYVGTGVDTVHVYAYPDPGSGRPPTWIGVASYGEFRRNVSDTFGGQFRNSGWTVRVSGLASGTYMLAAVPHDPLASGFTPALTRVVTVE